MEDIRGKVGSRKPEVRRPKSVVKREGPDIDEGDRQEEPEDRSRKCCIAVCTIARKTEDRRRESEEGRS
jgi:hypothetical protein